MEFLHMPKELNDLTDQVLSQLGPNEEEFPRMCGQWRRHGRLGTQLNEDVIWPGAYSSVGKRITMVEFPYNIWLIPGLTHPPYSDK